MKKKESHELKEKKLLVGSYQRVFKSKDGERVLADLKKRCFVNKTSLSPGQPDVTGFNEGRRSIFVRIEEMIETDVDKLKELPRNYQSQGDE